MSHVPKQPKITAAQMRKLHALGKERGKDIDALRAMTPAGSLSMLTVNQAAVLIDALETERSPDYSSRPAAPRKPRRRAGVIPIDALDITDAQRDKIAALSIDLGWSEQELRAWLGRRHFPDREGDPTERPLTKMETREDAQFVIELLKHIVARKEKLAHRRQRNAASPT